MASYDSNTRVITSRVTFDDALDFFYHLRANEFPDQFMRLIGTCGRSPAGTIEFFCPLPSHLREELLTNLNKLEGLPSPA